MVCPSGSHTGLKSSAGESAVCGCHGPDQEPGCPAVWPRKLPALVMLQPANTYAAIPQVNKYSFLIREAAHGHLTSGGRATLLRPEPLPPPGGLLWFPPNLVELDDPFAGLL